MNLKKLLKNILLLIILLSIYNYAVNQSNKIRYFYHVFYNAVEMDNICNEYIENN